MRNLEDLLQDLGGNGLAQIIIVFFANLPRLSIGWNMVEMSFANFVPKWRCLPDNVTVTSDTNYQEEEDNSFLNATYAKLCSLNTTSCTHRVFDNRVYTVVNEWDLVCERKWIVPLMTSIQMFGVLVGATLTGQMADRWGRKRILFLNAACGAVFNTIAGFSTSWQMFITCRCLVGVTIGGFLTVGVPYATEFVLPSKRAVVSIIPSFNVGVCLMALVAWLVEDWKMVHWIGGAMAVPLLIGFFIVPESVRWLAVHGRTEEAVKVIKWIAHWNKREIPKDYLDILKAVAVKDASTDKQKNYTYIDIYKGRHLLKTSIILQLLWCVCAMCQYGLIFGASAFGDSVYFNIFLMSVVVLPGLAILSFVINRLGRKKTAVIVLVLSSICGFASLTVLVLVPDKKKQDIPITVINMLNNALLGAAFLTAIIITNEIYPTVIRALGFGAANVVARIGAIVAPFALNFEDNPNLAFAITGGALLVAAGAVMFLDETAGKAMPDTTSESASTVDITNIEQKKEEFKNELVNNSTSLNNNNNQQTIFVVELDGTNGKSEQNNVQHIPSKDNQNVTSVNNDVNSETRTIFEDLKELDNVAHDIRL